MKQISSSILTTPVEGLNLRQGSLQDQLANKPTLIVFLRHFG
ncbi:MAG: hypothetical protein AAF490_15420 [Chloroflexota bacterium]